MTLSLFDIQRRAKIAEEVTEKYYPPSADLTNWDDIKNAFMLDMPIPQGFQKARELFKEGGIEAFAPTFSPMWHRTFQHMGFDVEEGYNPFEVEDFTGYEDYISEFIGANSPAEFRAMKNMIDINKQRRIELETNDAFWTRILANAADPINILAIPVSRGMGFVKGFKAAAGATAVPFGVSEYIRHQIDPTSTLTETSFNIGTGTLFAGAIGGLIGKIPSKTWTNATNKYSDIHDAIDKGNNINKAETPEAPDIIYTDGIRPRQADGDSIVVTDKDGVTASIHDEDYVNFVVDLRALETDNAARISKFKGYELKSVDGIRTEVAKDLKIKELYPYGPRSKLVKVKDVDSIVSSKGRAEPQEISARIDHQTNTVELNPRQIEIDFKNKQWTTPRVAGVVPLPKNVFRTPAEYRQFLIEHEKAHADYPQKSGESHIDLENRMNQIAIERINFAKKNQFGSRIGTKINQQDKTIEYDEGFLIKQFKHKPWAKGKNPFPIDAFKDPTEWIEFNLLKSFSKLKNPRKKSEILTEYNTRMHNLTFSVFNHLRENPASLKTWVKQVKNESLADYEARINRIASNPRILNQYKEYASVIEPNRFAPTGIAENMRWSQHPFYLLHNNKFEGFLANEFAGTAQELGGLSGMSTKGNQTSGIPARQGITFHAMRHNHLAMAHREGLWTAYKRYTGVDPSLIQTGPLRQSIDQLKETVTGGAKRFKEFNDMVFTHYVDKDLPIPKDLPAHQAKAIAEAVEVQRTYAQSMGKLIKEVGVWDLQLERKIEAIEGKRIPNIDNKVMQYNAAIYAIHSSAQKYGIKAKGKIKKSQEKWLNIADDIIEKVDSPDRPFGESMGSMSEKQRELFNNIVNEYLPNYEKQFEKIRKAGGRSYTPKMIEAINNLESYVEKYNQQRFALLADRDRMKIALDDPDNFPVPDMSAEDYVLRMWNRQAVEQNQGVLERILANKYEQRSSFKRTKDGKVIETTMPERVYDTIDNILKVGKVGRVIRSLEDALTKIDAPPHAIKRVTKKLKNIKTMRTADGKRLNPEQEMNEARVIVEDTVKRYGLGQGTARHVHEVIEEIKDLSIEPGREITGTHVGLMSRKLDIPTKDLINIPELNGGHFIETDLGRLMQVYHRRMTPMIEMTRRYGDPLMQNRIDELEGLVDIEINKALAKGDTNKVLFLEKEKALQMQAIQDLKEKALNIYGMPPDPTAWSYRAIAFAKNWMVMALMGKAAVAALPDMGRIVMATSMKEGLGSAFAKLGGAFKEFNLAAKEIKELGQAAEMALHSRYDGIMDLDHYYHGTSTLERFSEQGSNIMFLANALGPYTDSMKRFAGAVLQSNMIKAALKWSDEAWEKGSNVPFFDMGKITQREKETFLRLGIDRDDARAIALEWYSSGALGPGKGTTYLHLSNASEWSDVVTRDKFRAALAAEIDNAVITPGPGDKLNFMSKPLGSFITQFKGFGMAATNKTTMAAIQQRDSQVFHGLASMVALGYIVDMIRSGPYDDRSLLSVDRFVQAVDYSAIFGIGFELNNIIEMVSGGVHGSPVGIRPALGIDAPFGDPSASRAMGTVGGPSIGLFLNLVNAYTDETADTGDKVRAVRRLLPFNQLIWWGWMVSRLQREAESVLED